MAEEESLKIIATLDDQASAGLAKLQANVRQLGSGPTAQSMTNITRTAGSAASGLANMSSGFGLANVAMTAFTAVAPLIPVALLGMAASFAKSGVDEFAGKLTNLSKQAKEQGTSLAQYKADINTLMSAGISEQEAGNIRKRFTDIQDDLLAINSKTRQQILSAFKVIDRADMEAFLNENAVLPAGQAMENVKAKGVEIANATYEAARASGKSHEQASQEAAKAHGRWLELWQAQVLQHVRKPFREATVEEIALLSDREKNAWRYRDATREIGESWSTIKDAVSGVLLDALVGPAEALARAFRASATAVKVFETWWRKPEGATVVDLVDDLQKALPGLEPYLTPMRQFLADPPPVLLDMWKELKGLWDDIDFHEMWEDLKDDAYEFWESTKKDWEAIKPGLKAVWEFIKLPPEDQTFMALFKNFERAYPAFEARAKPIRTWFESPTDDKSLVSLMRAIEQSIPEWEPYLRPVREFIENPKQGLLNLWTRVKEVAWNMLPAWAQKIIENPSDALRQMFNNAKTAAAELIPKSIRDFINEPSWDNFNRMIDEAKTATAELIPKTIRDFINEPSWAKFKRMIEEAKEAAAELIPKTIRDFINEPSWAKFKQMIDDMKKAFNDMLPNWAKKLLGRGEADIEAGLGGGEEDIEAIPEDVKQGLLSRLIWGKKPLGGWPEQEPQPISALPGNQELPDFEDFYSAVGLGQRGGIVNRPTRAVIGEGGPEAVMPLNWLKSMMPSKEALTAAIPGIASTALWGGELAGVLPSGTYYAGRRAQLGVEGLGQMPSSMRDLRNQIAQFVHPQIAGVRGAAGAIGSETGQSLLGSFLPQGILDELTGFATGESREAFMAGRALDRAAQEVNVSGTGRISVDVRAPPGTFVEASGEGLFKSTEINRMTQMLPAEYGPVVATGVGAGVDVGG